MTVRLLSLLAITLFSLPDRADWPQWRGPSGQGHSADALPLKWDAKTGENVLWKAPLPQSDNPYSWPVVSGGRFFVTLTMKKTRERHVLAFGRTSGQPCWGMT